MRPFDRSDYLSLKSATRRDCEIAGPLSEIVKSTRLDAGTISRAGNVFETSFLPIDVAVDLDKAADAPNILRAMADLLGYDLVPRRDKKKPVDLLSEMGTLAKETGEAVEAGVSFARDPNKTPTKAKKLIAELDDVAEKAERAKEQLFDVVAAA